MTRNLTSAEAGDIAVTAAEGGIGYWAQIDRYDWEAWDGRTRMGDAFTFYRVAEATGGGEWEWDVPTSVHAVTVGTIRLGMARLLAGGARRDLIASAAAAMAEHDMGEIDSEAADVIVQLGLFGTIVYG